MSHSSGGMFNTEEVRAHYSDQRVESHHVGVPFPKMSPTFRSKFARVTLGQNGIKPKKIHSGIGSGPTESCVPPPPRVEKSSVLRV